MKQLVFVSVDKHERWTRWHSGSTDTVTRSPFLDDGDQVREFKAGVARDYPDSNLSDGNHGHEWHIKFAVVSVDENDNDNFIKLCNMMRSTGLYEPPEKTA